MNATVELAKKHAIDPRLIHDEALADLRKLTVSRVMPMAGRFGTWLHGWLDGEQARRVTSPEVASVAHCLALPLDLGNWTNREIGEGLVAANRLSVHISGDVQIGHLLDRLSEAFCAHAFERLAGGNDNG